MIKMVSVFLNLSYVLFWCILPKPASFLYFGKEIKLTYSSVSGLSIEDWLPACLIINNWLMDDGWMDWLIDWLTDQWKKNATLSKLNVINKYRSST